MCEERPNGRAGAERDLNGVDEFCTAFRVQVCSESARNGLLRTGAGANERGGDNCKGEVWSGGGDEKSEAVRRRSDEESGLPAPSVREVAAKEDADYEPGEACREEPALDRGSKSKCLAEKRQDYRNSAEVERKQEEREVACGRQQNAVRSALRSGRGVLRRISRGFLRPACVRWSSSAALW